MLPDSLIVYSAVSSSSWFGIGESMETRGPIQRLAVYNYIDSNQFDRTLAIITVSIFTIIIITAVSHIFHISILWTPRAITVTSIIITITSIVFAGRIISTAATWRRRRASSARRAITATTGSWPTITPRVEPPRGRGRGARPLNPISAPKI